MGPVGIVLGGRGIPYTWSQNSVSIVEIREVEWKVGRRVDGRGLGGKKRRRGKEKRDSKKSGFSSTEGRREGSCSSPIGSVPLGLLSLPLCLPLTLSSLNRLAGVVPGL